MKIYCLDGWSLGMRDSGPLMPWLGPALRGVVAARLKDRVCRLSAGERQRQGPYCKGCARMKGCPYGETFEPDCQWQRQQFSGRDDAARPVVIAPYYPLPAQSQPRLEIPLRLTFVGEHAARHMDAVRDVLRECGRHEGLGHKRVQFELLGSQQSQQFTLLSSADLPNSRDALPGTIPRLGVGLTSPLFLRQEVSHGSRVDDEWSGGERQRRNKPQPLRCPQFSDLFRAALRIVGGLFALYEEPLNADFAALKAAAQQVQMIDHCYQPFQQRKWTSRGDQRYLLEGCVGGGVYANVPLSLLPWMLWGGRLHAGGHRVAGAGGWRLVIE